ncbi:MAG: MGMT family protein [Chloroflexaceae bacterium]
MKSYAAIYTAVRQIPYGRVCSYGRVAVLAGYPGHARLVGYALHALRASGIDDVPWWRVVNRNGFISNAYEPALQRARLEAEGVQVDASDRVDLERYLWDGTGQEGQKPFPPATLRQTESGEPGSTRTLPPRGDRE